MYEVDQTELFKTNYAREDLHKERKYYDVQVSKNSTYNSQDIESELHTLYKLNYYL